MDAVGSLRKSPTSESISFALKNLKVEDLDLDSVLILVTVVVPQYESIGSTNKKLLRCLIAGSLKFMTQLVNYANSQKELEVQGVYKRVLMDVIVEHADCLYNYTLEAGSDKFTLSLVSSHFFGSKIFNLLADVVDIVTYLEILIEQLHYLLTSSQIELQKNNPVSNYLNQAINLNPILAVDVISQNLLLKNEQLFSKFTKLIGNSKVLDQRRLITKFLLIYLDSKINYGNYSEMKKVLNVMPLHKAIDANVLINIKSSELQLIIIQLLQSAAVTPILSNLIDQLKLIDPYTDKIVCRLICMFLEFKFKPAQKEDIMHSSSFLNVVTKRLAHEDREVRERTMYIAKLMSSGELKYESDFILPIPQLQLHSNSAEINFDLINKSDANNDPNYMQVSEISKQAQSLRLVDSDDENEEESVRFVFIKDLVKEYAKLGNSKRIDIKELFKDTIKLVRQKSLLSNEVEYYATTLLSNVACTNNDQEISQFEEFRINALVSILVVAPNAVSELIKILFNSELSLQQRMSILSSLALSARELRGLDDTYIKKPEYNFPTQRLPWDATAIKETDTKKNVIQEVEIENKNSIRSLETTWYSKKLQQNHNSSSPPKNRFRKYANMFFYPLANGWLNGINLGTYDKLFKMHYYSTLHLIYQCAYPVHEYEQMTLIFEQITRQAHKENLPISYNLSEKS